MRIRFLLPALFWTLSAGVAAGEMTGRVLSGNKPVIGATVAAIPYETRYEAALRETRGEQAPAPVASATTSADGRFKLTVPVTAPRFVVRATFGGLASRTVEGVFEKSDAEDLGDISLERGETLSGKVVDNAGQAIAGALVRLGPDGNTTTTTRDGLFRFADLQGRGALGIAPAMSLSLHAPGFEVALAPARFSGPPVTVRLKPSSSRFSGLLKDPMGKPAVDAVVRVSSDAVTRWVRTDPTGRFEIAGAVLGRGRLQAMGKDGSSLDVTLPAVSAPATFTLARAATLEGRVTRLDNGKLVGGAKITARTAGATHLARSGPDGRYRIAGLPHGSYRVTFDEKSFVLMDRRGIEVGAGELKRLDIALTPAVTLVGRVSDEKGQPIAGARGSLSAGAESRMAMMLGRLNRPDSGAGFVSGSDGTFRATRLSPGTNQKLTVSHPEFERRVIPGVDLEPGTPRPASVEVVLSPGFVLSGVVKDKEGRPIEGATVLLNRSVQLTGGRGGNVMSFATVESVRPQAETDFEGKFGFRGLSTGEYDVMVSKSGFTRTLLNNVKTGAGSSAIDVVLSPGASISGRLVQTNGAPVSGYSISARLTTAASGALAIGRGANFIPTDPDGAFFLDGLIPGTAYDLSIFGAGEFRGDPKKKGVVAPAGDIEIEVAARGRIAGRALDASTGAPITEFEAAYAPARAGGMQIVVRMGPGEGDRRTPFSSPEGVFAFEDVPPGNWDVTVWAKTYQEARTGGVAVAAGETKAIEVKAARGLVIRGRVVDARGGGGVQDASVSARDGGAAGGAVFMLDTSGAGGGVITDADGRFEIVGQAPGTYTLTARHSQFAEGTARITLENQDGTVDVPLQPGGTISGLVLSSQGGPLSGAEVSLQGGGDGGPRFGMEGQGTLTDGGGRFRFDHLAPGRYKVSASLRSEASPVIDVALNASEVRSDIRLALNAGATVRGVVRGLPENERADVMVGAQGSEDYFANVRTNAEGVFEIAGVPKGSLMLRATAGDLVFGTSRTAVKEITIAEGQLEAQAEIVFSEGLSISGRVTRAGAPVSGARVSAFASGTGRQANGRADESGAFRLSGLEAGRVTVMAFAENFGSQVSQIVELESDTTVDLTVPTARLSGTVLDAATSLPIESAVELQKSAPPSPGSPGGRLIVTTDTSGRFAFEDLDPVDYRLTARRSGYESVTRTVRPSDAGEDLRVELKRGSGLAVEARDAQMGFGLRSLFVRVQEGAVDAFVGNVSLDGDGKGEIPGIPAGSYSVTAQASGYAPVRIPNVVAPSTVLRLAFTPGGSVEFRTTEEFLAGGSKSGQLVSMSGAPVGMGMGGPNTFRLSRLTQRMENLTPGSYRLILEGGVTKTFEITEGGLAVVTIP